MVAFIIYLKPDATFSPLKTLLNKPTVSEMMKKLTLDNIRISSGTGAFR